jgi:DNA-directed RNA polymerase subunit N (RpoN/RPB10)
MRCWSCGKTIPENAKACKFCEAPAEPEPTEEEIEAVREIFEQMPAEVLDGFRAAFEQSDTAEEFVNRIMIGECPKCGSDETGSCENDPEIEDILVARCFQCGQLWCAECGRFLPRESPSCDCWEDDEEDEDEDDQ